MKEPWCQVPIMESPINCLKFLPFSSPLPTRHTSAQVAKAYRKSSSILDFGPFVLGLNASNNIFVGGVVDSTSCQSLLPIKIVVCSQSLAQREHCFNCGIWYHKQGCHLECLIVSPVVVKLGSPCFNHVHTCLPWRLSAALFCFWQGACCGSGGNSSASIGWCQNLAWSWKGNSFLNSHSHSSCFEC